MVKICEGQFPEHLDVIRDMFREYANTLGIDLAFQDFASELASLPGKYAAPHGRILLAVKNEEVVGCVAMRPLDQNVCEMKRLYVRPIGRGQEIGKRLAVRICQIAKESGYKRMRLDTLPNMQAAQSLYDSIGFKPIAAYVFNPIDGARFLELDLATLCSQAAS